MFHGSGTDVPMTVFSVESSRRMLVLPCDSDFGMDNRNGFDQQTKRRNSMSPAMLPLSIQIYLRWANGTPGLGVSPLHDLKVRRRWARRADFRSFAIEVLFNGSDLWATHDHEFSDAAIVDVRVSDGADCRQWKVGSQAATEVLPAGWVEQKLARTIAVEIAEVERNADLVQPLFRKTCIAFADGQGVGRTGEHGRPPKGLRTQVLALCASGQQGVEQAFHA